MSGNLQGHVALVTGAAGDGIGKATARRLAADGATEIRPVTAKDITTQLAQLYATPVE